MFNSLSLKLFVPSQNLVLWSILVLSLVTFISLSLGAYQLSLVDLLSAVSSPFALKENVSAEDQTAIYLLWHIRIPRILMAILVGSGLAISGATVQTIFRNPLADPTLIGVSSGAMLFAVLFIVIQPAITLRRLVDSTGLVYRLSYKNNQTSIATMLLAGIAITALCGGLTGLLIYYADESQLRDITFWNLGSLSGGNWSIIALISSITVLAGWKIIRYAPELEIMQLGDKESAYLGVPIERIKRTSIIMVCLMVGSSVAFTGLIGFVGLVVPHLIRLNVPTIGFKQLLILSGLVGSILLLLADTLARTIISPSELPIGILTAIMGAPFFLWLLVKNKY